MQKVDAYGQFQLHRWLDGSERPPANIHCFIVCVLNDDRKKILTDLGVTLNSIAPSGGSINRGDIPYADLQKVCELSFIQQIEFPQKLRMH